MYRHVIGMSALVLAVLVVSPIPLLDYKYVLFRHFGLHTSHDIPNRLYYIIRPKIGDFQRDHEIVSLFAGSSFSASVANLQRRSLFL